MKLKFAELNNPLFFAGINFGTKLDPNKRAGIGLDYDRIEKELIVTFNNRSCIIPRENVSSMEPGEPEKKTVKAPAPATGKPIKAQVQVPAGLKLED